MMAHQPLVDDGLELGGSPAAMYDQAPEQSMVAVWMVLMKKHFLLAWRRRRLLGLLFRTAIGALIPLAIWLLIPEDSRAQTRASLVTDACPLLGIIFVVSLFIQFVIEIVTDKELKMRYVQQVAGVSFTSYWTSYYAFYFLLTSFAVILYLILVMSVAPIYKYSDPFLMYLVYAFGFLQAFFVCMVVSTFISRARMAGVLCGVLSSLVVVLSQIVLPLISTTDPIVYALESLIPFVAQQNLLQAVGALEKQSLGFTFDTLSLDIQARPSVGGKIQMQPPAGDQLAILIASSLIYGLFAIWIDQVWQGEYGAAKPWNFFLRPEFMCPTWHSSQAAPHGNGSESVLQLQDLVKTFGSHRAVDGMTLEVKRGEIFALLGHNGAGKTTAINCITGMLPATAGSIHVCGVDVKTQLQEARRYMSICPQDNPLYLEYSVQDHLFFFAALRGVPMSQASEDIAKSLSALGLEEKRHARVVTLSGGQKRRLWVATSLLGRTPMVFLDEPTSGMDPANRRLLWELLVHMKSLGRCILFTTHYLDEADVLAQRKAVLDKGKVVAVGTSWDLKKSFGSGYHLRVVCDSSAPETPSAEVTALIHSHVKSAREEIVPREERSHAADAPRQWSFILPYSELPNFSEMLKELENRAKELRVIDFAIEMTSLEEVFMSLGHGNGDMPAQSEDLQIMAIVPEGSLQGEFNIGTHPDTGAPIIVRFPAGAQAGQQMMFTVPRAPVELNLVPPSERQSVPWAKSVNAVFVLRWRQLLQKKRSMIATFIVPAILMLLSGWGNAQSLNQAVGDSGRDDKEMKEITAILGCSMGMTLAICLAIALPYFTTTMVVDRVQRCTYVATSQGLPLSAYWLGTLINNYIHFFILAMLVPLCLLIFNAPFYSEGEQMTKILLSAICTPLPMLMFAYSCSRVFGSAEASSKFMPAICLMGSIIPYLAVYIMTNISLGLQLNSHEEGGDTLQTGKDIHFWANFIHVLMCFINPFYCLPGSFAAIGLSVFTGLVEDVSPDIDVQFPSFAFPIGGSLVLSSILGLTLAFDLDRLKGLVSKQARALLRETPAEEAYIVDTDVNIERERVAALRGDDPEQAVIYKDLVHTYNKGSSKEVRAVRGISLAVPRGECFTLLGPNGAGKTTTLDVLTGAIYPPTEGHVSINGHSVTESDASRLAALQGLGNCPQVDPLWPTLTGRQHLEFYSNIKGLPPQLQKPQVDSLLKAMGFSDFDANKPSVMYSGGMKRKLSLAIALIGSPPTLLLDEPSAAVDAAAKRHLWRVVRQRRNQTVILTTHSMEEAEALSDRLAIQVKGRLRCIGTPDHIKNIHGAGYQLEVLIKKSIRHTESGSFSLQNDLTAAAPDVSRFITDLCSDAKLLEYHEGRYLFQLPVLRAVGKGLGESSLADLFAWMQRGYEEIDMLDYSISRPSLEQVFIRFSKEQEELEG